MGKRDASHFITEYYTEGGKVELMIPTDATDDDFALLKDILALIEAKMKRRADRKTEPQTCEDCKHWSDTEDGCADRHGCKTTEDWQDWKDRMWAEAIVTEPTTEDSSTVKPQNYCDDCLYCDTCDSKEFFYACTSKATISKMEQVETMSCGECKYAWWNSEAKRYECSVEKCPYSHKTEPTTQTETQNSNLTFEIDEPQTDYGKSLQLFADILFDKEKSEQFLKECKAMGIEPQTEGSNDEDR